MRKVSRSEQPNEFNFKTVTAGFGDKIRNITTQEPAPASPETIDRQNRSVQVVPNNCAFCGLDSSKGPVVQVNGTNNYLHKDCFRTLQNFHSKPIPNTTIGSKNEEHEDHYKYIKKQGDSWVVIQKGTGKVLSHHDSREKAIASFKAMMVNKHGSVVEAGIPPIGKEWMPNKDNGWLISLHDENSGVEVHPGGSWRVVGPGHHHDAWRGDMSIYHEGESLDLEEAKKDAVEHFKKITAPEAEYPWDSSKVVRPYPWHEFPSLVEPTLHHLPKPNFLTEEEFRGQKGESGYPSTYLGSKTAGAWPSENDWEGHLRNLEELLSETQKGVGWHAAKGQSKEMKAHDKLATDLQKAIDDIKKVMKFPPAK